MLTILQLCFFCGHSVQFRGQVPCCAAHYRFSCILWFLFTDGIPHVCRGIQEKPRTDLDNETSCQVARKRHLSLPETERHCRLEKGFRYIFSPVTH